MEGALVFGDTLGRVLLDGLAVGGFTSADGLLDGVTLNDGCWLGPSVHNDGFCVGAHENVGSKEKVGDELGTALLVQQLKNTPVNVGQQEPAK
mmetsp:Transcript_11663/g.25998  ORF Transcript_11663/g.25998 Transcript_11663/m.25998 type:complete len:93 (-) Transcript_11663:1814-2092(-)